MAKMMQYLKIKDLNIPIEIKSYKNSKSVKIYFKGNSLTITKPKSLSKASLMNILKKDEEKIYNKYKKILGSEIYSIKQWKTGEKLYYKGEEFQIIRKTDKSSKIKVELIIEKNLIQITVPEEAEQEVIKVYVDKIIKNILKEDTKNIIEKKLPYWSEKTGFKYNQVKIRDATTRYGSCMPSKQNLYFSSRLIMLPEDKIDAIIVHELCHMKYKYHDKKFYDLVEKYIPNYKEIDRWLKKYGKIIMF